MKATEVVRISGLLAARRPPVNYEEVTIAGVRMLVILGDEVDAVIRFSSGGSADMPQLSTYPEIAESAAYADQRLAKQRASGRRNTTGEGRDWPRNWKLNKAKTAGKIWYAESQPVPLKFVGATAAKVGPWLKSPNADGLRAAHEEYIRTVPNSYASAITRVSVAFSDGNVDALATAVSDWLRDLNRQYYRFRPEEAATLVERLKPIMGRELESLRSFRERSIRALVKVDEAEVLRLFQLLRAECGPVGAGKALHILAPNFLPLWDDKIAAGYGVSKDACGYFQFMNAVNGQVLDIPENLVPGVTILKILDEYNYLQMSTKTAVGA
jgi:hypothetical protein